MPDIAQSFEDGTVGEQAFLLYLASRQDTAYICDVSKDEGFQRKGIDFILYREIEKNPTSVSNDVNELEEILQEKLVNQDMPNEEYTRVSFEVKSCSRIAKTGNFFLEIISNMETGSLGSFLYTQADFFVYYSTQEELFYFFPMPESKTWVLGQEFRGAVTETTEKGKVQYLTKGLLVPRKQALQDPELNLYEMKNSI